MRDLLRTRRKSEGQDLVRLGADLDDFRRRYPLAIDRGQGLVGCPTGNRARLSDVDGNVAGPEFPEQIPDRWDSDSLHRLGVVADDDLGGIPDKHNSDVVPDLDRAVGREVERDRRRGGIVSSSSDYVNEFHDSPFRSPN